MSIVALSYAYPPSWSLGGEVALHRALKALNGEKIVLTKTEEQYTFEGIQVQNIKTPNVFNSNADPRPIANQLISLKAEVVIPQQELSLPGVKAARAIGIPSVIYSHVPPRAGKAIKNALSLADYAIYNTHTSAKQWGEPNALVVHPPISPLPNNTFNEGDAYTILSSLKNKGIEVVLELAAIYSNKRFIIVRSPAEPTHGIPDLEERVAKLPNVELAPRVSPEEVYKYLQQTRILLVPSIYETYGMSAIEAAGYGIPSIHVDTPHSREGIGDGAILIPPLSLDKAIEAIELIEKDYTLYSQKARQRAEFIENRQVIELEQFSNFIDDIRKIKRPMLNKERRKNILAALKNPQNFS